MKIYLAADHAGLALKDKIKTWLKGNDYEVEDCGAFEFDQRDDYPDFISRAAIAVSKDPESRGIVLGGSGQGEAMVANRYQNVRAAVFYGAVRPRAAIDAEGTESVDPLAMVKLPRAHENANVLSLGARFLSDEEALQAVEVWLKTSFSGGERHRRRIAKF